MSQSSIYDLPPELVLGGRYNDRVPRRDQDRQRTEVEEILRRLRDQPGVILADEVGMGKTFVALAVAYSVARQSKRGPAVIMAPPNLLEKWTQDLSTFCELYLDGVIAVDRDKVAKHELRRPDRVRYGIARHGVDYMKLLDDPARERCHLIFLAQGAMGRKQTDKWLRLALIREALRRHGRGGATRLIQVKRVIHRFMARLLRAKTEQSASDLQQDLWQNLLASHPSDWQSIYNDSVRHEVRKLNDDPVPEAAVAALDRGRIDLRGLAEELREMPLRDSSNVDQRISSVCDALKEAENEVWKELLAVSRWRSPLLVMDEAHHLKNPGTSLARQLQSADSEHDLRTGDGAMSRAFDRMLFLTATPFQLGHQELVRVLQRFGDIRWGRAEQKSKLAAFEADMKELEQTLTESQRAAVALQRSWSKLGLEDGPGEADIDQWWEHLWTTPSERLTTRQRAVTEAYENTRKWRADTEEKLRPWVIRHNKGVHWPDKPIARRERIEGRSMIDPGTSGGLEVPPAQVLPFFLAARSATTPGKDLLGQALCSSYEAFRHTRNERRSDRDEEEAEDVPDDLTHSSWYLSEFDRALDQCSGSVHPKVAATVKRTVDLWEVGEKVLVFAFYRQTCRALRFHISQEIESRIVSLAKVRLRKAGKELDDGEIDNLLERIQSRFMDDAKSAGRQALDRALDAIVERRGDALQHAGFDRTRREQLQGVMRRFLRVPTTLIRCFPIEDFETKEPRAVVRSVLDRQDRSGLSWRAKFEGFLDFLVDRCSAAQRDAYLKAASRTQTGAIRVRTGAHGEDLEGEDDGKEGVMMLANVQVATGQTKREHRSRLMHAFNTPFFPDIFVCSEVMGEGVDLQCYCRYVVHHDLAWNPSQIEQRTGRIDRLGCKAENKHPIHVLLPYLAGASDERQFRVMSDREQWFRIVMGQDEVAKLIPNDADGQRPPLPTAFREGLSFDLGLNGRHCGSTSVGSSEPSIPFGS